jgi:mannose-6-phosphate isomerase-like protein (cupin superfamily)
MVKAVDVKAELAPLPVLTDRRPNDPRAGQAFARLARYRDGAVFAGSFDGDSEWERHRRGDEVVHVLAGETELTVLAAEGRQVLHLSAGMLTVVPKGCWHRFHAPRGVTLMTVTPQPTEHSDADDPSGSE